MVHRKIVIVLFLLAILTGCIASAPVQQKQQSLIAKPRPNSALVYVIRDYAYAASLVDVPFTWLNKEVGKLSVNQFLYIYAPPGLVSFDRPDGTKTYVYIKSGHTQYLRIVYVTTGIFRGGWLIEELDKERGRELLASSNLSSEYNPDIFMQNINSAQQTARVLNEKYNTNDTDSNVLSEAANKHEDSDVVKHEKINIENDDMAARKELALKYYTGDGVEKNYKKAMSLFLPFAKAGDPISQYYYGASIYISPYELEKKDAVKWIEKSAKQGYYLAQGDLAWLYYDGTIVDQNDEKAFYWYREAAEQGYSVAENSLGFLYANGIGVEENQEKAQHYYEMAAKRGNKTAQLNLGLQYYKGDVSEIDYDLAYYWISESAKQNHAPAINQLGIMYYNGEGVSQEFYTAYEYFSKASDLGLSIAEENRDKAKFAIDTLYKQREESNRQVRRNSQSPKQSTSDNSAAFWGSFLGSLIGSAASTSSRSTDKSLLYDDMLTGKSKERSSRNRVPRYKTCPDGRVIGATYSCYIDY